MTHHSRDTPQFYLTAPSPCPYLPGRHERKVFTHLVGDKAGDLNDLLTHGGFRRSQSIAYRPACDQCRACVSVRVVSEENRSLGTFMILDHITRARRLGLPYVYLGYWIEGSKKMDYKGRFLPQQRLAPSGWLRVDASGEVPSEPQD